MSNRPGGCTSGELPSVQLLTQTGGGGHCFNENVFDWPLGFSCALPVPRELPGLPPLFALAPAAHSLEKTFLSLLCLQGNAQAASSGTCLAVLRRGERLLLSVATVSAAQTADFSREVSASSLQPPMKVAMHPELCVPVPRHLGGAMGPVTTNGTRALPPSVCQPDSERL